MTGVLMAESPNKAELEFQRIWADLRGNRVKLEIIQRKLREASRHREKLTTITGCELATAADGIAATLGVLLDQCLVDEDERRKEQGA